MHSDLHERLEYLVNYSSQLIFVSGDSIAEQQKTLEAFVFQQHDDTEIAYLTAEENMDISDYRRQLCRQLLGQVVGSFVRPLNELLSSLNNFEGPVLIAITQAQHMPDKLLQELWDLVLQSRFAGNKQHLNVLLFANTQWAENAKQWLPAKNTETPLLISSQSISLEQPISELDKMMAQRRAAFQAHLDQRRLPAQQSTRNPFTSPWFYTAITLLFLALFGGLVTWQYGDALSSLFSPITRPTASKTTQVVPGSAYDQITDTDSDTVSLAQESPSTAKVASDSALVTNWQEAVDTLPDASQDIATERSSPTPALHNIDEANIENHDSVNNSGAGERHSAANLSPEQGALTQNSRTASTEGTTSAPASTALEPLANNDTPTLPETSEQAQRVEQWLSNSEFAIQMMGMADINAIYQFIAEHQLSEVTEIYKTRRYGGNWYVMVYRQAYPTVQDAREAIKTLPNYPSKDEAFVKGGAQILNEIALVTEQ
jgi:DamX protein